MMNYPTLMFTDQGSRTPPYWDARCRIKGSLHPTMRQHSDIQATVMDGQKEGTSTLTLTLLGLTIVQNNQVLSALENSPDMTISRSQATKNTNTSL